MTLGLSLIHICPCGGVFPVDFLQGIGHEKGRQFRLLTGLQAPLLQLGAKTAIQKYKAAAGKNFLNRHRSFPSFDTHRFRAAGNGRIRPGRR